MFDQATIPGLKLLAEAVGDVLEKTNGDPQYLSRAALQICTSAKWADSPLLFAIACAHRYWSGHASEAERETVRTTVVNRAEILRKEGHQFSKEWCQCALVMSALDVRTSSDAFAADYLLDFSLKAGVPLVAIRQALEANVPGLSEKLACQAELRKSTRD
jgi:hypothetical protein